MIKFVLKDESGTVMRDCTGLSTEEVNRLLNEHKNWHRGFADVRQKGKKL